MKSEGLVGWVSNRSVHVSILSVEAVPEYTPSALRGRRREKSGFSGRTNILGAEEGLGKIGTASTVMTPTALRRTRMRQGCVGLD